MNFRIREIRTKQNMTQEDLSRKSGVSRATVSGLENGKIKVTTTETLLKLAVALGVEVSELIFTENVWQAIQKWGGGEKMKEHVFEVTTCGKYEIAHLDGNEVSDIHSYSVERAADGKRILTLRLQLSDFQVFSKEELSNSEETSTKK